MPLMKIVWRTPCTTTVHSAADVDIAIDVRDFDFHAIGDPSISRRYPVMLLQLLSSLPQFRIRVSEQCVDVVLRTFLVADASV